MKEQEMRIRSLEDFMRVGEAAAILGVTTKTLRNWDREGKVRARRHPVNGYRIYLRAELEDLLNRITELAEEKSPRMTDSALNKAAL